MREGRSILRRETFTYTAPSGAVVVVRNVPTRATPDSSEVSYSLRVASKLQDLVESALVGARSDSVVAFSFDDEPPRRDADFEFEFIGPDANFANASIQTWRLVFDKVYTATKTAIRATTNNFTGRLAAESFPTVAFVRPASIAVGVRTIQQTHLVDFPGADDARRALEFLIAAGRWLGDEADLPTDLSSDPVTFEGILRAVEEIAPPGGDSVVSVKVQKIGSPSKPVEFTREKRERAKQERISLRLAQSDTLRKIDLRGLIDNLDLSGRVHLKDVYPTSEWPSQTVTARFQPELLPALLENFGKRVTLFALQKYVRHQWSTSDVEAVDVARTPPESESTANPGS